MNRIAMILARVARDPAARLAKGRRPLLFGDLVGRTLLGLWLAWAGFASLDFWLTGDPGYAVSLWLIASPVVLAAGFGLAYPCILLAGRTAGWSRPQAASRRPALAFVLLVFGLCMAVQLLFYLSLIGSMDRLAFDACAFENTVPGQDPGLVIRVHDVEPVEEELGEFCRIRPEVMLVNLLLYPLASVVTVFAVLVVMAFRLLDRAGPPRDRDGRSQPPGRVAVPVLALLYLAVTIALTAVNGIDTLPGTILLVGPFATAIAFPFVWALVRLVIWLRRGLAKASSAGVSKP